MTKISAAALGVLLAFSTVALGHAAEPVTGLWKLSIGVNDDPCTLSLAADPASPTAGMVTPSTDCAGGLNTIGRWNETPAGLQLFSPSGDMVAWLKEKNGSYHGSRVSDGQKLALDR
jgi:hypothetical protein